MKRSIQKEIVERLESVVQNILPAMQESDRQISAFTGTLQDVRRACKKRLSSLRCAYYDEILEGLLLAVGKLAKEKDKSERRQILELCNELLLHTLKELKDERKVKKDIVFLPYRISMWDSLESIWMAAEEDKENCNTYVIPIPYAERNPDESVAAWKCDRDLFPKDVPVLNWEDYDLQEMHPDVIFIHNPYDNFNFVMTADSAYYSSQLKSCTDLLIYCPYYVTSGGMGDGQKCCECYRHVDYIISQSKKIEDFFDPSVSREKLVSLGSPKLDRVIRFCKNPPDPPEPWKKKLQGKKVYFYNTSLNGMLADVNAFLHKMLYVFQCFENRKDVCLIWRPHPFLEATISSMREGAIPYYAKLKKMFLQRDIGIYDDTPDIEKTIALSDVYIGDGATSVTMLFAITGKPLFIFNNNICEPPKAEDWRGDMLGEATFQGQDHWIVTPTNQLYHTMQPGGAYHHVCRLCEYHAGSYYLKAIEVEGKTYICPANAQDILVVSENGIEERILLERRTEMPGAFAQAWQAGRYIFLIPFEYPAIVRYDTRTKQISYLEGKNHVFRKMSIHEEWRIGGSCVWQGELLIASPDTCEVLRVDIETLETEISNVGTTNGGGAFMAVDDEEVWLLPAKGQIVRCWRPATGEVQEYSAATEGFQSFHYVNRYVCDEFPFGMPAFDGDYVYLPPCWGNQFVRIDRRNGTAEKWEIPLDPSATGKSSYYAPAAVGGFLRDTGNGHWRFFYWPERKLYDVDIRAGSCQEVPIVFDENALQQEAAGFTEQSEWLPYACMEGTFHTLPDLLDEALPGEVHDKERQLRGYREVAANHDGTAGEKIYQFAMQKLFEKA